MGYIFDMYTRILEKTERQYPAPANREFRERKLEKIKWAKPEHRNFFVIIKTLAERGASTIDDIVSADWFSNQFKHKRTRYNKYRRIIVGDKKLHVTGLIDKSLVCLSTPENKNPKKYELTIFGIMYAIKLFMDEEAATTGNYKGMLKWDTRVDWYDFSSQTEFPETMLDILARNYPHVISLIFGKWEYLKKNPRINPYYLYNIVGATYEPMNMRINANTKYNLELGGWNEVVIEFYRVQLHYAPYPIKHFLDGIKDDRETMEFIDKMFYSYDRRCRELYYISQGDYWAYKNQMQKAEKFWKKAIDANDLMTAEEKRKQKEPSSIKWWNEGTHLGQ